MKEPNRRARRCQPDIPQEFAGFRLKFASLRKCIKVRAVSLKSPRRKGR